MLSDLREVMLPLGHKEETSEKVEQRGEREREALLSGWSTGLASRSIYLIPETPRTVGTASEDS